MKNITSFLILGALLVTGVAFAATTSVTGKLIALDAGHGGMEIGAYNSAHQVAEKDVNLAVVLALKTKLEAD